jgi:hypothetical protein
MMFDMGLRRFSPMLNRLLAIAMREVGMVRRLFMLVRLIALRGFLMDGERPFRDAPQLSCDGRLLVLPWSPPLNRSLQYAEKTACCLRTIAQCGTNKVVLAPCASTG